MRNYVECHNNRTQKHQIEKFLIARAKNIQPEYHSVYIQLDESREPADQNYFYQYCSLGAKILSQYGYIPKHSQIKDCRVQFARFIAEDCGDLVEVDDYWPVIFQTPNWVRNKIDDIKRTLTFSAQFDPEKIPKEEELLTDFSTKMMTNDIGSVQEYYEGAQ